MKHSLALLSLLTLTSLTACGSPHLPPEAYASHTDPENLIDVSTEVVTIGLYSKDALVKLSDTVAQDKPERAELGCSLKDTRCAQAKEIFERRDVPVKFVTGGGSNIKLVYNRTVVRDCDPRYINNSHNDSNLNHPAFGCALVGNTLQMVTDKHEFTNPSLSDYPDGEKAAQYYSNYLKAPKEASSSADAAPASATGAPPK